MYTFYTWWLLFVGTSSKCERKGWEGSLTVSETNNSFKLMKQTLKSYKSAIRTLDSHVSTLNIHKRNKTQKSVKALPLSYAKMMHSIYLFHCFGGWLRSTSFSFSLSVRPSVHLGCITNIRPDVKTSRWQKRASGHQVSWLSDKGLC